jgi:TATA element modulatory factor
LQHLTDIDQTVKAKKAEADLDFSNSRIDELERSLATQQEDLKKLRLQLQQSQRETASAKQDLSHRQEAWEANLSARIEEEKSKWAQQGPQSPYYPHQQRLDSPSASLRKPSDFGLLNIVPNRHSDPMGSISDRPPSRRPSFQPGHPFSSERSTPPRQSSTHSITQLPMNGTGHNMAPPEAPSIDTLDPSDDFFAETPATPASHGTHRGSTTGVHDLLSHATVAAGPSVQLVERLSQTVRRLESERGASKDELTRLTTQRDEARQEVVELMREVEAKRAGDERIEKLEMEVKELDSRYQASLEMLGEKSETVEELRADVGDLKRILRETMDSMMK